MVPRRIRYHVYLVPRFLNPCARSACCCHWCSSDSDLSVMQRVMVFSVWKLNWKRKFTVKVGGHQLQAKKLMCLIIHPWNDLRKEVNRPTLLYTWTALITLVHCERKECDKWCLLTRCQPSPEQYESSSLWKPQILFLAVFPWKWYVYWLEFGEYWIVYCNRKPVKYAGCRITSTSFIFWHVLVL